MPANVWKIAVVYDYIFASRAPPTFFLTPPYNLSSLLNSIDISATSISKKWIIFTRQLLWHIGSVINERYSCKHAILVMKSHSDLLYDWFGNLVFSGSAWNEMKSCWTSFEYPQCTRRKKNLQPQRLASEQLNDLSLCYYSLCQNSTFLFFLIWLKYLIL